MTEQYEYQRIAASIEAFKVNKCGYCKYSFLDIGNEIKCNRINYKAHRYTIPALSVSESFSNLKKINLHQISRCKMLNYYRS